MPSITFTSLLRQVLFGLLFSIFMTRFLACTAQLNGGELGMPIQNTVVHETENPQVEDKQPTEAGVETARTKRFIRFLEDRFRRDSNLIPVLEELNEMEETQRMMDPRRLKRYQRYGRARIGGTIVMGK